MHSRIAIFIGAVILGIALAVPISAYASEEGFASGRASSFFTDVTAEAGAGLACMPVDAGSIEIDEEGEDAVTPAAPLDIAQFVRAQKGSNRPIDGVYRGYAYLQGAERNDVCLVAVDDYAVLYVDAVELAARTGTQGWNDVAVALGEALGGAIAVDDAAVKTELSWIVAYLQALDDAAANGSSSIGSGTRLFVTTEESFDLGDAGLRFSFNQEYASGSFYTSVIGIDGSDVMAGASGVRAELRFADFCNTASWAEGTFAAEADAAGAFGRFLDDLDWSPLWVTLKTTGTAIVIVFILGLLAAWWSLRIPSRAQDIADSIFTIPMVLPPTVCGFVLLLLLGKNTPVGQWFIDIGFPLIFSWPATVLAAVVVSFPLMYRSARGAFESIDRTMLDAARTLGWSEGRIFFRLMLPLAWSSIAAGTVLAFARALGEFGATLFLAGNYVGVTRTVPIAIYFEWMNGNTDVALFWTGVIIVFSFMVILFINLWSRRTTRYRRRTQDA
ncbi:MAG: molybdate ABC transporter permease subunit [Slackia faecicanis]|nr:molybdate ABC transporter permease subunit [Slackia faecicanis]